MLIEGSPREGDWMLVGHGMVEGRVVAVESEVEEL